MSKGYNGFSEPATQPCRWVILVQKAAGTRKGSGKRLDHHTPPPVTGACITSGPISLHPPWFSLPSGCFASSLVPCSVRSQMFLSIHLWVFPVPPVSWSLGHRPSHSPNFLLSSWSIWSFSADHTNFPFLSQQLHLFSTFHDWSFAVSSQNVYEYFITTALSTSGDGEEFKQPTVRF